MAHEQEQDLLLGKGMQFKTLGPIIGKMAY